MRFVLRLGAALTGALLVLASGVMLAARARADVPPSPWIAFLVDSDNFSRRAITRMRFDGRLVQPVLSGDSTIAELSWSGMGLLYTAGGDVFRVQPDGSDPRSLTQSPGMTESGPAWSPDGAWIAYTAERNGGYTIMRMRADGSDPQPVTEGTYPAWSPDGAWIAYMAGQKPDIFRVRPDGADAQPLTFNPAADMSPAWSPDGQWVYFWSRRDMARGQQLFRVRAGTGREEALPVIAGTDFIDSWSPDHRWLTLIRMQAYGLFRTIRVDPQTGQELPITPDELRPLETDSGWSPDGQWFVFVALRGNGHGVYRVRSDGSDLEELIGSTLRASSPVWSPPLDSSPLRPLIPAGIGLALLAAGTFRRRSRASQ